MQTIQQLEEAPKDLQLHRATIEGQLRAARELDEKAQAALVAGTGNADAAAQARAKVAPLAEALTALDSQITEHLAQISSAHATARRGQQRATVLEIAQFAAKLEREIQLEQRLASEELEQRAERAAEKMIELRRTRERFKKEMATLADVQPYQVLSGHPTGDEAASERMQRALQELAAEGASTDFMNAPENLLNQAAAVRQKPHGALVLQAISTELREKEKAPGVYMGSADSQPRVEVPQTKPHQMPRRPVPQKAPVLTAAQYVEQSIDRQLALERSA
jgi:hypothetical protein